MNALADPNPSSMKAQAAAFQPPGFDLAWPAGAVTLSSMEEYLLGATACTLGPLCKYMLVSCLDWRLESCTCRLHSGFRIVSSHGLLKLVYLA